jgi:aryl-alcohol dehydrogenase-like predicted oxidoreductase
MLPRFSPENFSKNLDLVKIFEELAAQKGAQPAQVVLAWILAQGSDFIPIPGTKNIKYLEQNLGALNVTITSEDDARIRDTIASLGGAIGERAPVGTPGNLADTPEL